MPPTFTLGKWFVVYATFIIICVFSFHKFDSVKSGFAVTQADMASWWTGVLFGLSGMIIAEWLIIDPIKGLMSSGMPQMRMPQMRMPQMQMPFGRR